MSQQGQKEKEGMTMQKQNQEQNLGKPGQGQLQSGVKQEQKVQNIQTQQAQQQQSNANTQKPSARNSQEEEKKQLTQNQTSDKNQLASTQPSQNTVPSNPGNQSITQVLKKDYEIQEKCKEIFSKFEQTGYIKKNLLIFSYRALGKIITEEESQQILASFSKDLINFNEFVQKFKEIKDKNPEDLNQAFKCLEGESGRVQIKDLQFVLEKYDNEVSKYDLYFYLKDYIDENFNLDYKEIIKAHFSST